MRLLITIALAIVAGNFAMGFVAGFFNHKPTSGASALLSAYKQDPDGTIDAVAAGFTRCADSDYHEIKEAREFRRMAARLLVSEALARTGKSTQTKAAASSQMKRDLQHLLDRADPATLNHLMTYVDDLRINRGLDCILAKLNQSGRQW